MNRTLLKEKRIANTWSQPISEIIAISDTSTVLFTSDLSIVSTNAGGMKLLRFCRPVYPLARETIKYTKPVTRTVSFNKKTWVLRSYPVSESRNVMGALITASKN